MTDTEWGKFAEAVNRLMADGTWTEISRIHLHSMGQVHVSHGTAIFLPWHRKFHMEVESRLQMAMNDCSITIPYWNWALEKDTFTSSSVWENDRFGSVNYPSFSWSNGCVTDGSFGSRNRDSAFGKNDNQLDENPPWNQRTDCIRRMGAQRGLFQHDYAHLKGVMQDEHLTMHQFDYMSHFLEYNVHNAFHIEVGGHMASFASPYDPIFFLHHGFTDFMWQQWQDRHVQESDRWSHRQHDRMNSLLWDGIQDSFPVTDVMHSMDILDDDGATPTQEKACVVYHERKSGPHACEANWDRIQTCLADVVGVNRLTEVPRIKVMTSMGDVCSPLNRLESDMDRMWLENMVGMGMLDEVEVQNILDWEVATNNDLLSRTPVLDSSEASECDKTLCFSTTTLLEICASLR